MAYSNCCNGSGNCGSFCGNSYARRNDNSWYRNSYAALNTIPGCTRRNYPFYTGNCPNECGCYNCGCTAGVTNQNYRWGIGNCGWNNNCNNCCDGCGNCNTCGNCQDNCCTTCNNCGCDGCNGCNNCGNGCDNYGHCDCPVGRRCPVYGLFSANVPLSVTAGAAVPLTATSVSNNDFTVSNGTVTVHRCGTYLATYTINLPAGADVSGTGTTIMNVNGVAQPGTLITLGTSGSYTAQTVFTANRGTTVSIVTGETLTVSEPAGQNVVTLTLTRID